MKRFISMVLVIIMVLSMGVAFGEEVLTPEEAVKRAEYWVSVEDYVAAEADYNVAKPMVDALLETDATKEPLKIRLAAIKVKLDTQVTLITKAEALRRTKELVDRAVKWEDRVLQIQAEAAIDELVAVYGFSNNDEVIKGLRRELYYLITETDRVEKLERDAIAAVEKAEDRLREVDVDNAWDAVEALPKSNFKLDLEARIRKVEDKIYYSNQEKSLEVAIEMIEWAEKTVKREDYDMALKVMDRVQPSREKTRLLDRLAKLDAVIAKNEKPVEATEAEVKAYLSGLSLTVSPWAEKDVYNASKAGLLGSTNLSRVADLRANINREDFVEIIMNHVYANVAPEKINIMLAVTPKMHFSDTTNFKITQATQLGIINGMGDGTFAPRQNITREQMAVILDRVNKLVDPAAGNANAEVALRIFADIPMISSWARQAVANQVTLGTIEGMGNNMFSPASSASREQAIKVLMNK